MSRPPRPWLLTVALVAAVVLAYLPVRQAGFIWDDDAHVTANPTIIGPLGLKEIWTSAKANYFPLTMTSFWVQHALWGLDPWPYHAVSVGCHALGAVLLFLVLRRLQVPGAALGAALWALHPVQVESVAWISELKNTQSGVFFFLSSWLFLRWRQAAPVPSGRRDYWLALACAVLAVLSKSSTVMLPVVLGLIWWWVGGWRARHVVWLAPFFAVSLAASGWTIWEQKVNSMASGPDWQLSLLERGVLAGRIPWFYLGKLLWPDPLIFIYPRWPVDASHVVAWLPVAALVLGAAALFRWRDGRARPWFLAGAYFGVSLFPVLGFFDVFYFRYSYVADHFQYLASVGPLALAGAGLARGLARRPAGLAAARTPAAVVAVGALAVLSWRQGAIYRDSRTLWADTVVRNPQAWIAHVNLGVQLLAAGEAEGALAHYRAALALRPGAAEIETNVGVALLRLGHAEEAVSHLEAAVRRNPKLAEAYSSLGLALATLGRNAAAEQACEAALRLQPEFPAALFNLANVLVRGARLPEAIARLEQALRAPGDAGTRVAIHRRLAEILADTGRRAESVAHYAAIVKVQPTDREARNQLAGYLFQSGRYAEAAAHYEEMLRLEPAAVEARSNLGSVLVQLGRPAEAIAHYREALRQRPDFADARANLGLALARTGHLAEAQAECEAVLRLAPEHPVAKPLLTELRARASRP